MPGPAGPAGARQARRNVIAIGGSAGALDAILAAGDRPAARFRRQRSFVVSHIGSYRSHLPELLSRAGPLPARHAEDGETIRPGTVYVAPPDRHMLVYPERDPAVARAAPAFHPPGNRSAVPLGRPEPSGRASSGSC